MTKLSDIAANGWVMVTLYFITAAGAVMLPAMTQTTVNWPIVLIQGVVGGASAVKALLQVMPNKEGSIDKN